MDHQGSSDSGAIEVASAAPVRVDVSQCIDLDASAGVYSSAWVRGSVDQIGSIEVQLGCHFFAASGCIGSPSVSIADVGVLPASANPQWTLLSGLHAADDSSASALCGVFTNTNAEAPGIGSVFIDAVRAIPGMLFDDGFESGDVGRWSATTP